MSTPPASANFQMPIKANRQAFRAASAAFDAFCQRQALPEQVRRNALLALDEIVMNVIAHGLAGRDDGEIDIRAALTPEALTTTVSDNGEAFDPLAQPAPDTSLSIEDRPLGGLGIHLLRQLMDEVAYRREQDRNIVVFVARLAAP